MDTIHTFLTSAHVNIDRYGEFPCKPCFAFCMIHNYQQDCLLMEVNLHTYMHSYTVNHEYFVVKIFSDSLACAKIKRMKMHAQY